MQPAVFVLALILTLALTFALTLAAHMLRMRNEVPRLDRLRLRACQADLMRRRRSAWLGGCVCVCVPSCNVIIVMIVITINRLLAANRFCISFKCCKYLKRDYPRAEQSRAEAWPGLALALAWPGSGPRLAGPHLRSLSLSLSLCLPLSAPTLRGM